MKRTREGLVWVTPKRVAVVSILILAWLLLVFSHNRLRILLAHRSTHEDDLRASFTLDSRSEPRLNLNKEDNELVPVPWKTPRIQGRKLANRSTDNRSSSNETKWAIVVPADEKFFDLFYDDSLYSPLLQDNWKVVFVVDSASEAKMRLKTESENVIVIDLNTPLNTIRLQEASSQPNNKNKKNKKSGKIDKKPAKEQYIDIDIDITAKSFRSVAIQSDPQAKKRIYGFLFAIAKGATVILNVEHGEMAFASTIELMPERYELSPIDTNMFFPGKLFADPYRALERVETTPSHPFMFDDIYQRFFEMFESNLDVGPQRLFSPIQSILPLNSNFSDFVSNHLQSVNMDLIPKGAVAIPEGTYSLLTTPMSAFYEKGFWALPIAATHTKGLNDVWGLWVQRLLLDIGGRVTYSNGTIFDYAIKLNYTNNHIKEFKENSSYVETQEESETKQQTVLNIMDKITTWKFVPRSDGDEPIDKITFFDHVWYFSLHLWKHDIISNDDVLLLQAWLEDLVLVDYEIPEASTKEQLEIIKEREDHIGERILLGDLSGWGLNNQRDNLICAAAVAMANNYTLKLPDVYTKINQGGQPFYYWHPTGEIAGFGGIDQLPIAPFSTFWDEDYFIENLKDLITVTKPMPRYIQFNSSDVGMPLVPPREEGWKYRGELDYHSRFWKQYMRNRHVLYIQNSFGIALYQKEMLQFTDEKLYFRRRFAAAIKMSPLHKATIDYAFDQLHEAVKPFFHGGRYVCIHWNRQHGMYAFWGTRNGIPSEHLAKAVNRYLKRVINLPKGFPLFIFGAGIDNKENVPKDLYEDFSLLTVAELLPGMQAAEENTLNQILPLHNFEIAARSFMYFSTNHWSTFDLEVCFLRHRVRLVTFETVDICPGLPRSWRWRADAIDPILKKPLKDFVEEVKHNPAEFDWDTYPNITRDYRPQNFTESAPPPEIGDINELIADPWSPPSPSPSPILILSQKTSLDERTSVVE